MGSYLQQIVLVLGSKISKKKAFACFICSISCGAPDPSKNSTPAEVERFSCEGFAPDECFDYIEPDWIREDAEAHCKTNTFLVEACDRTHLTGTCRLNADNGLAYDHHYSEPTHDLSNTQHILDLTFRCGQSGGDWLMPGLR